MTAPVATVATPAVACPLPLRAARPNVGDLSPDKGPAVASRGHAGDAALQARKPAPVIPGTRANFEGLANQDNFNVLGLRVNPPDPVGEFLEGLRSRGVASVSGCHLCVEARR